MSGLNLAILGDQATEGRASLYPDQLKISVGTATCGRSVGAGQLLSSLQQRLDEVGLPARLSQTGCIGFCQKEPLVDVRFPGGGRFLFSEMDPSQARTLVDSLAQGDFPGPLTPWAFIDQEVSLVRNQIDHFMRPDKLASVPALGELPFFARQQKIVLRNCGYIDPESLAEYIARGGYDALAGILTGYTPRQVIDEVSQAGLRGRGGGGFPTGRKWRVARDVPSQVKYVICNADEGNPGAYMDRTVLESDPHSVIEGLIIGAYAIGANQGYIYIREEYPLAIECLTVAVVKAKAAGLLGQDILGSGFDFELDIIRGAGAFVCGEETAMIASIEGGIGEPRTKPPYPAVSGLWGKPTIINNVKTWSTVPVIISRGSDWFSAIGTPGNAGTVVFSLVGQTSNAGLVEVPLGIPLRDVVHEIGGLSTNGEVKAVQTGGPLGGCIPERLFDMPVEFEALAAAGTTIGSGGMVVLDHSTCMVDLARYFLNFNALESCGKCTACREGTRQLSKILDRITHGQGEPDDLSLLEEVSAALKAGSLCGLGQAAPNPILSSLRYFLGEYEAHVTERVCPTGKCPMTTEEPHA